MPRRNRTNLDAEAVLTPRQNKALDVLLSGGSTVEAASAAGCCRQTVSVWINRNARFMAALGMAQAATRQSLQSRLVTLATKAADTLAEVMEDPDTVPGDRIRAAGKLLDAVVTVARLDTEAPSQLGEPSYPEQWERGPAT